MSILQFQNVKPKQDLSETVYFVDFISTFLSLKLQNAHIWSLFFTVFSKVFLKKPMVLNCRKGHTSLYLTLHNLQY